MIDSSNINTWLYGSFIINDTSLNSINSFFALKLVSRITKTRILNFIKKLEKTSPTETSWKLSFYYYLQLILRKIKLFQYYLQSAQTRSTQNNDNWSSYNTTFVNCHRKARGEEGRQIRAHAYSANWRSFYSTSQYGRERKVNCQPGYWAANS